MRSWRSKFPRERGPLPELDSVRNKGKLYGQPRIFNDLLSSQPLCFNLFGELQADLAFATRTFKNLTKGRVQQVTGIEFEHSPGRGDLKYTGDRSAFDVYVEFKGTSGSRGFIGIEVKYHEDLGDKPASHRDRYDEIAVGMGCFKAGSREPLKAKPLQQIWRDHLLAGNLLQDAEAGFNDGLFAFLSSKDNYQCVDAIEGYKACLSGEGSFVAWTLEEVVAATRLAGAGPWLDMFHDRYLAFDKLKSGELDEHDR